ncbi:MAG: hypothetical protein R3C24_12640 [Cyanobacteriota/Melainabacteria group bacterium]
MNVFVSAAFLSRFSLLACLLMALFVAAQPVQAQESGWMLTQRSEYMGDQYVYVSKSGFKWVNPKAGANLVTASPDWVVTMFNDKTRQYFQTTFEQWRNQMISTGGQRARDMQAARWKAAGSGNISGLKATKYVMSGGPIGAGGGKLSTVKAATCWVSDEIEVPAAIADVLSRAYGMPRTRYFPLRVTYVTGSGQVKSALDTYRSSTCAIPAAYFAKPNGYALASSQAEVLMDDETRQIFEDMAGEAGMKRKPVAARPAANSSAAAAQKPAAGSATPPPKPGSTADQLSKLLDALKGK